MAEADPTTLATPILTSHVTALAQREGVTPPVIAKLADALHKAVHATDTIEALRKWGYETLDVGPDEFATRIREDVEHWTAVVRAAGLKS